MLETLQQLDRELLLTLNGMHAPYWDNFMWLVSAKLTWGAMYATLLYILCRNFNWRVVAATTVAIVLVIAFADQMCSSVIRPAVERMRPSNPDNPISEFVHILHGKRGGRYGFPSCHAANSFALAFFITFLFRQRAISLFLFFWAVLNSYSRIYLGVHYPGDLIAGMLVGLIGAGLIYAVYRFFLRQPRTASILAYTEKDRLLLQHPAQIRYTRSTLLIGGLTILVLAIYSGIALLWN